MPQCKNCQYFLYTHSFCHKKPVCAKCDEGNKTKNCLKLNKSKAKCANCGEAYTTNWKGCSSYKKLMNECIQRRQLRYSVLKKKQSVNKITTYNTYAQMDST